ncbi:hypothetical protein EI94DRAFT_1803351 [Lactarius quietus]|nr:hypothetical protein EI94DRAFT_1803351 [Lactarius quietus]
MDFIELSAEHHIHDECDILKYYCNFLMIALPLVEEKKLTQDDFHAEFFRGFHADNHNTLAREVFIMHPHQPRNRPFDIQDVLTAAWQHFASNLFHKPQQHCSHANPHGHSRTHRGDPKKFIQWLFGDKCSPKSTAHDSDLDSEFEEDNTPAALECGLISKDEEDPTVLLTKLKSLSIHKLSYLILYTHHHQWPQLPISHPPALPWQQWSQQMPTPMPSTSSSTSAASDGDIFFSERNGACPHGCVFCNLFGHHIHGCPAVEEYYRTGHIQIIGNWIHLPTGEPVPNDGHRLGLKASIDAWLVANPQSSSTATTLNTQHDPPPHAMSYSFEIIPEPAVLTGAYITEEADSDTGEEDEAYTTELYDMYKVFVTK